MRINIIYVRRGIDMRKPLAGHAAALIGLFCLAVLSQLGCSMLFKEIAFIPRREPANWITIKDAMVFQTAGACVEVHPVYLLAHVKTWGPPLLPIIPTMARTSWSSEYYQLYLRFSADSGPLSVDLSAIRLVTDHGKEHAPSHFAGINEGGSPIDLASSVVVVEPGQEKSVWLAYNAPYDDIERFTIVFGEVTVADIQIAIPPLTFERRTRHHYYPMYLD